MRNYRRFITDYKTTNILIGICVIVYIIQMLRPETTRQFGLYAAPLAAQGFYRIITCAFLHGSPTHLLMNMMSLYNIGTYVEERLGDPKYLLIVLVSALSSGLAVVTLSPAGTITIGFSGVIFGLFGAFTAIMIKTGAIHNDAVMSVILRMLVPNIIISLMPGVSWQGHLGGLIGGLLAALLLA